MDKDSLEEIKKRLGVKKIKPKKNWLSLNKLEQIFFKKCIVIEKLFELTHNIRISKPKFYNCLLFPGSFFNKIKNYTKII